MKNIIKKVFILLIVGLTLGVQAQQSVNRKLYFQADGTMSREVGSTLTSTSDLNKLSANLVASLSFITSQNGTNNIISQSFNVSANPDRALVIFTGILNDGNYVDPIDSITYGNIKLTKIKSESSSNFILEYWLLENPTSGSNQIEAHWQGKNLEAGFVAVEFSNVNLDNNFSIFNSKINNDAASTSNLFIQSGIGDFVFDIISVNDNNINEGIGQTTINAGGTNGVDIFSSYIAGKSDSTEMSWTGISGNSIHLVSLIKGKGTQAKFILTPSLCNSLVLGTGIISAKVHISNTSNIQSGQPIKALLKKSNGNIITSLNRPQLIIEGTDSMLVWENSFIGDTLVAEGDSISLEISPDSTGISFSLDYGDELKSSYLSLPIQKVASNSLGIYNAAYGGGTALTTTTINSTIYLRDTVRSAFGAYRDRKSVV